MMTAKVAVRRDDARALRFIGELIDETYVKSRSGLRSTRWVTLKLYRTAAGKYVCEGIGKTIWQGEADRQGGLRV